jgi:hypothetical protein
VLPAWKGSSDPASVDVIAELMERYGITPAKPDTSEALAE